jgi:hypothetical protein
MEIYLNKILLAFAIAAFPLSFVGAVAYDVSTASIYAREKIAEPVFRQSVSGSIAAESHTQSVIVAARKDAKIVSGEVYEFESGVHGIMLRKIPLSKEATEDVQVAG